MSLEEEEIPYEVDPEHPWVEASSVMTPRPMETRTSVEPVELAVKNGEDEVQVSVALMNVVTPCGITTTFLQEAQLAAHIEQCIATLRAMREEKQKSPLVVATAQQMREAAMAHEALNRIRR